MASKGQLTERAIRDLPVTEERVVLPCGQVPGLSLRASAGRRVFSLRYRVPGDRALRRIQIGRWPEVNLASARRMAKQILHGVAAGQDPARDRRERCKAMTFAEFARDFMADAEPRLKPVTIKEYRRQLAVFLVPRFGKRRLGEIRPRDISEIMRELAGSPTMANRYVALLRVMLNRAATWGLIERGSNPCIGVKMFRDRKRTRYLDADEIARLFGALEAAETPEGFPYTDRKGRPWVLRLDPWAVSAIRMLLVTGCRKGEVLSLEWGMVDFERETLHLVDSKTGPRDVFLNSLALEELARLWKIRLADSPYVFPSPRVPGKPYSEIRCAWCRVCDAAGLRDVRLHDLRHSAAALAVSAGASLPVVGAVLGHRAVQTTGRYAHLFDHPVRAAVAGIDQAIRDAIRGGAKVVPVDPAAPSPAEGSDALPGASG